MQVRRVDRRHDPRAIFAAAEERVDALRVGAPVGEERVEARELGGRRRPREQVNVRLAEEALVRRDGARVGRHGAAVRLPFDGSDVRRRSVAGRCGTCKRERRDKSRESESALGCHECVHLESSFLCQEWTATIEDARASREGPGRTIAGGNPPGALRLETEPVVAVRVADASSAVGPTVRA